MEQKHIQKLIDHLIDLRRAKQDGQVLSDAYFDDVRDCTKAVVREYLPLIKRLAEAGMFLIYNPDDENLHIPAKVTVQEMDIFGYCGFKF